MGRLWLRVLMAVFGLSLLAVYLLASLGVVLAIGWVVSAQTDPLTTALAVVAVLVGLGYLSYRVGTARLLERLEAVPLARQQAPGLHQRLDRLVARMDVGRPDLRVADVGAPNALSLGRGARGTIVLDRRLLRLLTLDELEGILAHELAHAESYDSLVKTLAASTMRSLLGLLFVALLPAILALTGVAQAVAWARGQPGAWDRTVAGSARRGLEVGVLVAMSVLTLAVLAHSRRREFAADERAAAVTGRPLALARALRKIERASERPWDVLSPLYVQGDEDGPMTRLLSTHPPMDERIDRLLAMARQRGRRVGA
jgi:heat shock protein HtpX